MEKKSISSSWTVWFNVILIIIGAITQISQTIYIDPEVMTYIATFGNIILRLKTTQPIL